MREGIDLLLEGAHIIPSDRLIRSWIDAGGIAVGVIMAVSDEEKHKSMIKSRDAHSFRSPTDILQISIGFAEFKTVSSSDQK